MQFTNEHCAFRDSLKRFVRNELPPGFARKCDAEQMAPLDQYRRLAAAGFLGTTVPESYGGSGGGCVELAIMLEELARGMVSFSVMVFRSAIHGSHSLLAYGSEEQRRTLIPKIVSGEMLLSLSLTEPQAGSDAANIKIRAVMDGDCFVINGQKMYSSAAHIVDLVLLVARTATNGKPHEGISLIFVDPRSPGVTINRIPTLGERAVGTNMVFYDNVRVPVTNLVGRLHGGWAQLMSNLEKERLSAACFALGGCESILEQSITYAKQRVQFGSPIGSFQVIQHKLADMAIEIQLARSLIYDLAEKIDRGERCRMEASIAKAFCAEMYNRIAYQGMQIHGGLGYTMETDMQLHLRDARLMTIGGGSSEIMRNIIAKELGLPQGNRQG